MRNMFHAVLMLFLLGGCVHMVDTAKTKLPTTVSEEKKKQYVPKIEPYELKSDYINLTSGTITTPSYYSKFYLFEPKEGEPIFLPVKWNDKIGEYQIDEKKRKEFFGRLSLKQVLNFSIMYIELMQTHKLKLEILKIILEKLKGDPA